MTKKLFVVLVVITALLISFSFVIGAKKLHLQNDLQEVVIGPAPEAGILPVEGVKPRVADPIPAEMLPERPDKAMDVCDFWGEEAWYTSGGWFWGDEYLCNLQDPAFGYTYCPYTDVFPMEVAEIWWEIYVGVATEFDWQGFIYANIGTDCPLPGDVICTTAVTHEVLDPGFYYLYAPLVQPCCVYEPYFAGIYIPTDITANLASPIWGTDGLACQSYYLYGPEGVWYDWVADFGYEGMVFVNSWGNTRLQNECEEQPICCQFEESCSELTPTACLDAGGTPCDYNDARYECVGGAVCKLPWEPDTCTAELICPPTFRLQAGETAEYEVTVKPTGYFPSCYLTTVPDPVCTDCNVSVFVPNPVNSPETQATLTIQTAATTPVGVYNFQIMGGTPPKASTATLEVVAPSDQCEMYRDTESWAMFWATVGVGDMEAVYFNPSAMCPSCGEDVYPFEVNTLKIMFYNHYGYADHGDFTAHVYRGTPDPCDGPQELLYSFDINNITTTWTWLEFAVPEPVCVFTPFFVALEHTYDPGEGAYLITCLFEDVADCGYEECSQWAFVGGEWAEWSAFMGAGYLSLRAIGTCDEETCPQYECVTLDYTTGPIISYAVRPSPTYGRDYLNERFTAPSISSTLGKVRLWFFPDGTVGTPDLRIYVWESDIGGGCNGNDVPGAKIDSMDIPHPVPTYPNWAEVDFYPNGITLLPDQEFHVGYTCTNYDPNVPTNQLGLLLDAGGFGDQRLSEYFGLFGAFCTWNPVYGSDSDENAFIQAEVCFDTPDFFVTATPSYRDITAGEATFYTVNLIPVLGFSDPVDLTVSGLPTTAGTASFTVTPVTPPGSSQLDVITLADPAALGTHYLTITATSGTIVHQKQVKLRLKSPFNEEAVVEFDHGQQRLSNFGALANGALADNFLWYGRTAQLYDGSIISAVPIEPYGDHMALDLYDCEYLGFIPDQGIDVTYEPWCAGGPSEEYYGEIAYAHFYTTEDVISCEYDSLFVIGLKDVDCTDFSIKIKIYYNPTETAIPQLWAGVYEDWDIGIGESSPWLNWGDMDTLHSLMWQYDLDEDSLVFGIMKTPFYDEYMHNMTFVSNYEEVYAGSPHALFDDCGDLSPLYNLMTTQIYRYPDFYTLDCYGNSECDFSQLIVGQPFSLNPGEKHIEIWIDFGRNLNDGYTWEQWYHKILRYVGFYRGDVNASDTLELPALDISDLVYLINYLYKGGPAPEPFADQGNVDGSGPLPGGKLDTNCPMMNVNLQDLIYLVNYVYKGGPAPVDYVRFIEQYWSRESLFLSPFNQGPWPE